MNESSEEKRAHTAGESVNPSENGGREDGEPTVGTTTNPQPATGPGKGDDGDDQH